MFKIKNILLATLLLLLFYGCTRTGPVEPSIHKPNEGIRVKKINSSNYSTTPKPNLYYAQIKIDYDSANTKITGPDAKTFLAQLEKLFHKEVKDFGISIEPTINKTILPEIVLFNYHYDNNKNEWIVEEEEGKKMPMVRLDNHTDLTFKIKYFSKNKANYHSYVKTSKKLESLTLISSIITPYITKAVNELESLNSRTYKSTKNLTFSLDDKLKKTATYEIINNTTPLGEITFSLFLYDSLLSGAISDKDAINNTPKLNHPLANPLARVPINENQTLNNQINNDSVQKQMKVTLSTEICTDTLEKLDNYGLNKVDKYITFFQLLKKTMNITKALDPNKCLNKHEKKYLTDLKLIASKEIVLNYSHMENIKNYLINPKEVTTEQKNNIAKLFKRKVDLNNINLILSNTSYSEYEHRLSKEFLETLKTISFKGVYINPRYDLSTDYTNFLFTTNKSDNVYICGLKRNSSSGHIETISFSEKNINDITPNQLKELNHQEIPNETNDIKLSSSTQVDTNTTHN